MNLCTIKVAAVRLLSGIFLVFMLTAAVADPEQFFQDWTRIDVTGPLGPDLSNLRYLADIENRNEQLRPELGVGYRITPLISVWGTYTQIISNDGSPPLSRPAQQVIWELFERNADMLVQIRTRSEEFKQEGQPEWLWRWRERVRIAFPNKIAGKFTPVMWEEVLLNLNHPEWVNPGFLDQNRAFIGIDSPVWKNTFVETGYINQYRFTQPVNQMSHILFVGLMIVF